MIENALMTTFFLTYLMLYACFRFIIGLEKPGPAIFFPADLSALYVFMLLISDLLQDMVMGKFMERVMRLRFGNIFWRPWHADTRITVKVAVSQIWSPIMMLWLCAPYIVCSNTGAAFLAELREDTR